jgi:LacI family xylobiose transport system transcriptional regulator
MTVAAIAQLAGVSAATVSKVLNGQSGVGDETRRRVESLLREQGYRRPAVAQPTEAIEVVFYGLEGELTTQILHGVERVARRRGLALVFTDATHVVENSRSWSEQVLACRPIGVIAVHSRFTPEQHEKAGGQRDPARRGRPDGRAVA